MHLKRYAFIFTVLVAISCQAQVPIVIVVTSSPTPEATVIMPVSTPTLQPTATRSPTQTPTATATPAPTATPRPTDTPAPTATALPTETAAPTQTPLPTATETGIAPTATATTVPTITPLPTNTPEPIVLPTATPEASEASVLLAESERGSLHVSKTTVTIGEWFTLRWSFDPAPDLIGIEGYDFGSGQTSIHPILRGIMPATGETEIQFAAMQPINIGVRMVDGSFEWFDLDVMTILCTEGWFFEESADISLRSCPASTTVSRGSQQEFQNGYMLWTEAFDSILVLPKTNTQPFNDAWAEYPDHFDAAVDPVDDPTIVPPEGLLQPQYGFGKLWRENEQVRAALGWAVDSAPLYTVVHQEDFDPKAGPQVAYRRMLHGAVVEITSWGTFTINNQLDGYKNPEYPR